MDIEWYIYIVFECIWIRSIEKYVYIYIYPKYISIYYWNLFDASGKQLVLWDPQTSVRQFVCPGPRRGLGERESASNLQKFQRPGEGCDAWWKFAQKKLSMIGVMIVMIGVIYLFNDLWWVNQINDYMLISLISLRDGLGRCLFFQICFLWNVVDMVPDMDGYRSTLFRIPRPRIGSMELPNTIFSGKNMRKTLFPTDYPWKQQVGQFETQVTGELIPWVLGCGTWICQVVNHLPTFRFFLFGPGKHWLVLTNHSSDCFSSFDQYGEALMR